MAAAAATADVDGLPREAMERLEAEARDVELLRQALLSAFRVHPPDFDAGFTRSLVHTSPERGQPKIRDMLAPADAVLFYARAMG